ncbi:hypothetical protein GE09DRAFT_344877 [Coniochaeta sp. 2T2.1]|nr:hypothetical protein GE09DRAFT_344877 [Coniochaeta sp. 2T2.1]
MARCSVNHDICRVPPEGHGFMPTRLVHVGNAASNNEPFLYEVASEVSEPGRGAMNYVALSHCWGKAQISKTTCLTYADRK